MKKNFHISRLIVFDFVAAVAVWVIFYSLRKEILGEVPERFNLPLFAHAILIGFFWVILYSFFGFYTEIYRKSRIKELFTLFTISFLGAIFVFFALLLDDQGVSNYKAYYKTFAAYFALHFLITAILKISLITFVKNQVKKKKLSFNTLIIGSGKNAVDIFEEIQHSYEALGLRFLAYVSVKENENAFGGKLRSMGTIENLGKIITRCHIEQVVIAVEEEEHMYMQEILFGLEKYKDIRISITPDIHKHLIGTIRVNHSFDIPLMDINQDLMPVWQHNLKRVADVLVASLVLIFGFPFFVLIGILIKITSKGPVFYSQERIGKDGNPFHIFKFRSMYVDSEQAGPALSSSRDLRITNIGRFMRKTRIDEFPQFYNVLIGDMSLVGPRPERQFFIDQIVQVAPHYKHLHKVKPGITSLGQVKFGYASNVDEMVARLKYDILYIENMSFSMDLRIILYTFLVMVQGRGK